MNVNINFNKTVINTTTLLIVLASTCLLYLQAPFFFHEIRSADTVYHAAKIARVLEGSFFSDPFTGTLTLYPPLFHIAGAGLASLFSLSPDETIHILGLLTHILLSGSVFFLGYAVFRKSESASIFLLLFALIIYAPAAKYHLLQSPATFSHPFIFFGMGCLFFRKTYLGAFLLGIASQIWWYNVFFALPFLVLSQPKKALIYFSIPFLFTAAHIYAVRDVLDGYLEPGVRGHPLSFIKAFFLRGQGDYLEALPPWKWRYDHGPYSIMKTGRDLINFGFFFLISLPASLFMVLASFYAAILKRNLPFFMLFMGCFLATSALPLFGNSAHLYRVQLYSHALLLLYLGQTFEFRKIMPMLVCLGGFFTIWHVLHNPLTIGKRDWIESADQEMADALKNIKTERFFFTDTSYRTLATLTPFYSLVGNKDGRYYFQDAKSAIAMKQTYDNLMNLSDDHYKIKYFGFNKFDPTEKLMRAHYLKNGEIIFENPKWTLLKIKDGQS